MTVIPYIASLIYERTYVIEAEAGSSIKMTVSIKSRVRAVGPHPSGEGGP